MIYCIRLYLYLMAYICIPYSYRDTTLAGCSWYNWFGLVFISSVLIFVVLLSTGASRAGAPAPSRGNRANGGGADRTRGGRGGPGASYGNVDLAPEEGRLLVFYFG